MDITTRVQHIRSTFTTLQNQIDALADDLATVVAGAEDMSATAIANAERAETETRGILADVETACRRFDNMIEAWAQLAARAAAGE